MFSLFLYGTVSANEEKKSNIIDIMLTLLEVADIEYPHSYKGNKIYPMDGQSFYTSFKGEHTDKFRQLFWEHEGKKILRSDDWELVKINNEPWELYIVGTDPAELDNLRNQKQLVADSLKREWNKKASEINVRLWTLEE